MPSKRPGPSYQLPSAAYSSSDRSEELISPSAATEIRSTLPESIGSSIVARGSERLPSERSDTLKDPATGTTRGKRAFGPRQDEVCGHPQIRPNDDLDGDLQIGRLNPKARELHQVFQLRRDAPHLEAAISDWRGLPGGPVALKCLLRRQRGGIFD